MKQKRTPRRRAPSSAPLFTKTELVELLAAHHFWAWWGPGWRKADRTEQNDYRTAARRFLRALAEGET